MQVKDFFEAKGDYSGRAKAPAFYARKWKQILDQELASIKPTDKITDQELQYIKTDIMVYDIASLVQMHLLGATFYRRNSYAITVPKVKAVIDKTIKLLGDEYPHKDLTESVRYLPSEGESPVVHHVSFDSFDRFKPMSHFGSKDAARGRAATFFYTDQKKPMWMYTVRLKLGNVLVVDDLPYGHQAYDTLKLIKRTNKIPKAAFSKLNRLIRKKGLLDNDLLADWLKNVCNINTLKYLNRWEDPGSYSYIITDPDQVRILKERKAPFNYKRGVSKLMPQMYV
jgi:hypothetical protein